MKVGAIHLKANGTTYADILDSDARKVTGGYGVGYGLLAGSYSVKVGANAEKVAVQSGKITEF